jgi:hypothetical protein
MGQQKDRVVVEAVTAAGFESAIVRRYAASPRGAWLCVYMRRPVLERVEAIKKLLLHDAAQSLAETYAHLPPPLLEALEVLYGALSTFEEGESQERVSALETAFTMFQVQVEDYGALIAHGMPPTAGNWQEDILVLADCLGRVKALLAILQK